MAPISEYVVPAGVEREGDEVDAIVVTRAGRRSVSLRPA